VVPNEHPPGASRSSRNDPHHCDAREQPSTSNIEPIEERLFAGCMPPDAGAPLTAIVARELAWVSWAKLADLRKLFDTSDLRPNPKRPAHGLLKGVAIVGFCHRCKHAITRVT
jgi:hypothetical protein